jgi:hypothetical protein
LGINPWIYDVAAYNVWLRPVGLLACLDSLRRAGCRVALLDCLDPTWGDVDWPAPQPSGAGPFPKREIPGPVEIDALKRAFGRYGLDREAVAGALQRMPEPPDVVLVTTLMTYWYPGAMAALDLVRRTWPEVPAVLGGVYPTCCPEHARRLVQATNPPGVAMAGPLERGDNWRTLWSLLGAGAPAVPEAAGFGLALDRYPAPDYSPVLGSRGCPFACAYCASRVLQGGFRQRSAGAVWAEIEPELAKGVRNLVFFDDALLVRPEAWLTPVLERLARFREREPGLALHAPNALHLRYLTPELTRLFKRAGLATVRLGLETLDFGARMDAKVREEEWERGLDCLLQAGFAPQSLGVYLLFGLPGQDLGALEAAVSEVRRRGLIPHLAQYSPIPGSELFPAACEASPYDLAGEPLFQNSSLWPCVPGGFDWAEHRRWKTLLRG